MLTYSGAVRARRGSHYLKSRDTFLQSRPLASWGDDGHMYCIVAVDLDAPEPAHSHEQGAVGRSSPWLHWLVTDCPGGSTAAGKELVEYDGPTPPRATHRYVFVLLRQTAELTVPSFVRPNWSLKQFLETNSKSLTPTAANFFYVEAH